MALGTTEKVFSIGASIVTLGGAIAAVVFWFSGNGESNAKQPASVATKQIASESPQTHSTMTTNLSSSSGEKSESTNSSTVSNSNTTSGTAKQRLVNIVLAIMYLAVVAGPFLIYCGVSGLSRNGFGGEYILIGLVVLVFAGVLAGVTYLCGYALWFG